MSQAPPPPPLPQAPMPAQPGGEELQKPRRPRRTLERPLPWLVGAVAVFLVLFAIAFLIFNSIKSGGGATGRGAFTLILFFGILALLLILAASFYTLRKRRRSFQEGMPGTMMTWFKAHIWLGLLAFGAAMVHVLTRPISNNLTTGKITLIVFGLLVLSGVGWRLVYRRTPTKVSSEVGNLAVSDTQKRLDDVQVEIDKLSAGRSAQFQALVAARLRGEPQPLLDQTALSLPEQERAVWVNINRLAYDRQRYIDRVGRQQKMARFLQGWRVAHWPLAAILFGLIVVHIFDVFGGSRAVFGGGAAQFPSSESCANCHTDIANDWKQSVMSHAATSPIMVAQVELTIQENTAAVQRGEQLPFGTVCTACHGPIGVELTGAQVLPFPGTSESSNPYATGKKNRVLAEGITCVVCHALDAPVPPGEGALGMPVNESGLTTLGRFTGPPQLSGGPLIPVADHQTVQGGYMSDPITSSSLCGSCHVVALDLNGDEEIDRNAKALTGEQPDLVLQQTYLEWLETYPQSNVNGCVSCHALPFESKPIVNSAPFGGSPPDRSVANHAFVGVDYDLTPGHPGLSEAEFQEVLEEREDLLENAARIAIENPTVDRSQDPDILNVTVRVQNVNTGHTLPTGFAFVRQMWLEVVATNVDTGERVCLAPLFFDDDNDDVKTPCGSGEISEQQDLPYCEPAELQAAEPGAQFGNIDIDLAEGATAPVGQCDLWLTSWQKILTNGPPGTPQRREVAFQSRLADIVDNRVRQADGPDAAVAAMDPPGTVVDDQLVFEGDTQTFDYEFLIDGVQGNVTVSARLRFRHVPPYFLRALDGRYPSDLTADDLIKNLTIVDMEEASLDVPV